MIHRTLLVALGVVLALGGGCRKKPPVDSPTSLGGPASDYAAPKDLPTPAQQVAKNFTRVNFEFDSAVLTSEARRALDDNARILVEHTDVNVQIQGHCDERGTTVYNIALGDQRANAVRKYLVSAGVAPSRIQTLSYGEERPLAAGAGEYVWAQNRRAEFLVTNGDPMRVVGTVR